MRNSEYKNEIQARCKNKNVFYFFKTNLKKKYKSAASDVSRFSGRDIADKADQVSGHKADKVSDEADKVSGVLLGFML